MFFARRDHLVGFLQIAAHRLFEKDRRPRLGARDHHVAMPIEMPIRDADDLRSLLLQHLAIVGVSVFGAEPFLGGVASGFVFIGDGDNLGVWDLQPDDVQTVAVIATTGAADDGDAIVRHSESSRCVFV